MCNPMNMKIMKDPMYQMCNQMNFANNPILQNIQNNEETNKNLNVIFKYGYSTLMVQCQSKDKIQRIIDNFTTKAVIRIEESKKYKYALVKQLKILNMTIEEFGINNNDIIQVEIIDIPNQVNNNKSNNYNNSFSSNKNEQKFSVQINNNIVQKGNNISLIFVD